MKLLIKKITPRFLLEANRTWGTLTPIAKRDCNLCGFHGWFKRFGRPPRLDAKCPKCESLERHRLMKFAFDDKLIPVEIEDEENVLHFAPESQLKIVFSRMFKNYKTADLFAETDLKINIEKIALPDKSFKLIIVNHVLEHVNDILAAKELDRILDDDGILLCMVPIIEGWSRTYEIDSIQSKEQRWIHYGQYDHVRYYGSDFRERIESGGLKLVKEITAEGDSVIKYGLLRGEKVFVFQKISKTDRDK